MRNVSAVSTEREVEALRERIAGLVADRQELRERGASRSELERNRACIAEAQHALAVALIALHGRRPVPEEALV